MSDGMYKYENTKKPKSKIIIAGQEIDIDYQSISSFKNNYEIELREFIRKNGGGKLEIDFLEDQIEFYNSEINRISLITDEDIRNSIRPDIQEMIEFKKLNVDEKNDWINFEVEIRRGWINDKLISCNFRIIEYEILLNRYYPKQEKEECKTTEKDDLNNSQSRIFKDYNTLKLFELYIDKHIIEPYVDYSYLFQRLLKKKLIHRIRQQTFMKWLKEEKYITESIYDKFLQNESFRTLKKSYSKHRENNFNNIFKVNTSS